MSPPPPPPSTLLMQPFGGGCIEEGECVWDEKYRHPATFTPGAKGTWGGAGEEMSPSPLACLDAKADRGSGHGVWDWGNANPPPLQDPVRNRQKGCGLRDPPSLSGCCLPMGILPPPPPPRW